LPARGGKNGGIESGNVEGPAIAFEWFIVGDELDDGNNGGANGGASYRVRTRFPRGLVCYVSSETKSSHVRCRLHNLGTA
jgi:hypothetical protein